MGASSATYQFEVEAPVDRVRERLATTLTRLGGRITTSEPSFIAADAGNVDRAQFRGVWATKPIDLPVHLAIGLMETRVGCGIHVTMTDGLVGVRLGTRTKYTRTFEAWADLLRTAAADGPLDLLR